ncbi:MAG: ABC transporter substrate-binding protein [Gammaproteobacteria bacterium]
MRRRLSLLFIFLICSGCSEPPWNNPYPASQDQASILYDHFAERPKHLDPVRAYSSNEYVFLGQIYEAPLQYHFLKRPYELTTLTATEMPKVSYFDQAGNVLPEDAPVDQIAWSKYLITIKPGIQYQPHPAFAKDAQDQYLYHANVDLDGIHTLSDFPETGTRELTAADYVHQIKRMANTATHSPIAGLMSEYIVGLSDLTEEISKDHSAEQHSFVDLKKYSISGVREIDRYSYEIKLKGKYPQFIYWLSMYFFSPMPWEADLFYSQPGMDDKNISLNWYPIGTGPYMLTENNPNRRMVLSRNPNFHGEKFPTEGEDVDRETGLLTDAGKEIPFIDRAIYSLEKESIPSWSKFQQGYYDTSGVSSDSFDQAVQFGAQGDASLTDEMKQKEMKLLTAVTTSTYYTGFNMLDDVVGGDSDRARKLRQAISIAIDFEEYISIFFNGRGVPAQGPIPPGIFGAKEAEEGINPITYEWQNGAPERKSIEAAKQLMIEAGYPQGRDDKTGKQLILYFDSTGGGPGSKALLNWLQKQFKKLGVQLVIRATDYNRFQEKMLKGTAQIFQWGWNADYPDPENFMFLLYGPNGKAKHKGENASNYSNAEFDALFEKMKNMNNGSERQAVIDEMVAILRKDSPWLWGWHPVAFSLHHGWYKNAKPNLMANNTLKYKRIDPATRTEKRQQWNPPVLWPFKWVFALFLLFLIPAVVILRRKHRQTAL